MRKCNNFCLSKNPINPVFIMLLVITWCHNAIFSWLLSTFLFITHCYSLWLCRCCCCSIVISCINNAAITLVDKFKSKFKFKSHMKIWSWTILTHWGRHKWTSFRRRHFQMDFLEWNCLNSDLNFTEVCFQGSNKQYSSNGSDYGLAPSRRQAIIWTNDG